MLEAGVHFGHLKRKWNPAMAPYIFMEKNGVHILDLKKTTILLDDAINRIGRIVSDGGDVLFVGSCGGVSYPGSDPAAMVQSLQRTLGSLPEHTKVYPGHDYGPTPVSTLAWELTHNPALLADTIEAFCAHKGVPVPTQDRGR